MTSWDLGQCQSISETKQTLWSLPLALTFLIKLEDGIPI